MFAEHMKQKNEHKAKEVNMIQPLEFKMAKQKLQTLGLSPDDIKKLNISIVPKQWSIIQDNLFRML